MTDCEKTKKIAVIAGVSIVTIGLIYYFTRSKDNKKANSSVSKKDNEPEKEWETEEEEVKPLKKVYGR